MYQNTNLMILDGEAVKTVKLEMTIFFNLLIFNFCSGA